MSGGPMHIVYAADGNYAMPLGVSLLSLLACHRDQTLVVHILDCGIGKEDRARIEGICAGHPNARLRWHTAADACHGLDAVAMSDRGSVAQFARVFFARYVEDTPRVLYLDCDTLVRKSLVPLWARPLDECTLSALGDAFSVHYRAILGLRPDDLMFNSGVMLIDTEKWRSHQTERRVLEFIKRRGGLVGNGDQGALNAVLSRECMCVEPEFNAVTGFFDFNYGELIRYRRPPRYYSRETVERARRDPAVVHYTSSFLSVRPWERRCLHPFAGEWLAYKLESPWRDVPQREARRGWPVRAMCALPGRLMLPLAGFLQSWARPWLYRAYMRVARRRR